MPKRFLPKHEIQRIIDLRRRGHSLPEIRRITGNANSTVFKYIAGVKILPKYLEVWKSKQGGSKRRSLERWDSMGRKAKSILQSPLSRREKLLVMASLYWGEGNKKELVLTNTDPSLIKTFVGCLSEFGVQKEDIKISIRIFDDINQKAAVSYWAKITGIKNYEISSVNILKGKKSGKLKYGMCRIRVKKGGDYFKFIMSVIALIKSEFAAVVQRIEQGTPKP